MAANSAYYECIDQGLYDSVSPGEACSMAVAEQMGVYDPQHYYNSPEFAQTRTYTPLDDVENRTDMLCIQSLGGKEAYPICAAVHGFGYIKKAPGLCTTVDCPPGFTKEGLNCVKPKVNAIVPIRDRCDEQWDDWYKVPNYHLGNRYMFGSPSKPSNPNSINSFFGVTDQTQGGGSATETFCFAPCPDYSIPFYNSDPVDDQSMDFTTQPQIDRCISRADFFSGKYAFGSDYCPLAWVYRIGMLPNRVQAKMKAEMAALEAAGTPTEQLAHMQANIATAARASAVSTSQRFENLGVLDQAMQNACATLNTKERVNDAYRICRMVADEPDTLMQQFYDQLGDDPSVQQNKIAQLQQACDLLFCDPESDALMMTGQDPICFPYAFAVEESIERVQDPGALQDLPPPPLEPAPNPAGGASGKFIGVARSLITIMLFVVVVVSLVLIWNHIIYPYVACPMHHWWLRVRGYMPEKMCPKHKLAKRE